MKAVWVLCRALTAWYSDRQGWADLVARGMMQDWSWSEPALDYIELWVSCTLASPLPQPSLVHGGRQTPWNLLL